MAPHSPFAVLSARSQSGRKLPLASFQDRPVLPREFPGPNGSNRLARPVVFDITYRLMPNLIAVFASPAGSHTMPNLGLRSFQFGTSSRAGNDCGGASAPAGTDEAATDSRSHS